MSGYKDYLQQLAPPWLKNAFGTSWHKAIGDALDHLFDRARNGVKGRFPDYAPPDAVAGIGSDRQIERGPGETLGHYRARLKNAWITWPYAGTAYGVLIALRDAGFSGAVLEIVQRKQYNLDADGNLVVTQLAAGSWLTDFVGSTFWSKFDVLFPAPYPTALAGPPASNSQVADQVRRIIKKWKSAHSTLNAIRFLPNGTGWGYPPTQTWGDGSLWGDDGVIVTWPPV